MIDSLFKFGIILFLFLLVLFSSFGEFTNEIPILNLFFGFCIAGLFYKFNKISFFLLLYFIIQYLWCMSSLYYIEQGNYISEQVVFGENIGAMPRYIFYMGVFLFSAYSFIAIKSKSDRDNVYIADVDFFTLITKYLFTINILLLIFIGIFFGFPLFNGELRFSFYQKISIFRYAIFGSPIIAFLIGISYAYNNSKKYIIWIFVLIIFMILFSDKFTRIFNIAIAFTMGFYLSKNINYNSNVGFGMKTFIYAVMFFILSFFTLAIGYVVIHGASHDDIMNQILSRALGLQAHVWYGVDYNLIKGYTDFNPNIFWTMSDRGTEPLAGLPYLMYEVANEDYVFRHLENGARFTNGYPAIVLISFGYFYSFFMLILLGLIFGAMMYYIYKKIKLLQPIRLIIALVFYYTILIQMFLMGEVYLILRIHSVICIIIMLFDIIISKHKNFKFKGLGNG